jgi:hypothetical protein
MNSCWILLPEDGVVTVQNGHSQPVSIVIRSGLHPTVVVEGDHFYPRSWKGFIAHNGALEHWDYPTGPVRQIRVRKNNDGTKWLLVVWK